MYHCITDNSQDRGPVKVPINSDRQKVNYIYITKVKFIYVKMLQ